MPALGTKETAQIEAKRSRLQKEFAKLRTKLLEVERELLILEGTVRPRVILPELHAVSGRIDAQKVADFMVSRSSDSPKAWS